ncbi:MAG: hypothetical protein FP825_07055 [Hyphomonas sp.]|uniref:hypothetical protein n=1 Tax=Hyphomonas sp. TaxID=87 RepID=UPI001814EBF9|nr:hypothetical protein [Hyphomonas sp.]MBA3068219.1 hypothetical protein [Hyphomonas sp.]MBU4060915.1 hypothetical protein [Alphaproteobacteria bacterium]MBU4164899.1 hypothetical protein [Alphaproteobacteria bacterium]
MNYRVASFVLLLAVFSHSAGAQTGDAGEREMRNETVTVYGKGPERAEAFVEAVVPKSFNRRLLARWDESICISVVGPPVNQAQFIADRISQSAIDVGLKAGGPGCSTNLLVAVTTDPDLLIQGLVKDQPQVFGMNETGAVITAGKVAFEQFQTSERPVRWWAVTETVGADGMPLDGDAYLGSGKSSTLAGNNPDSTRGILGAYKNVPTIRADSTRLSSNVRSDISRVIVIIDANAISGNSLAAIADYTAFVSLAEVDSDVDASPFPSVLNLFKASDEDRLLRTGMTDWDRAYLDGLYSAKRDAASTRRQKREISMHLSNK